MFLDNFTESICNVAIQSISIFVVIYDIISNEYGEYLFLTYHQPIAI